MRKSGKDKSTRISGTKNLARRPKLRERVMPGQRQHELGRISRLSK